MFSILQLLGIISIGCSILTTLSSEKVCDSLQLFTHDVGGSTWHGTDMLVMLEGIEFPFLGREPLDSNCILSSLISQHWWQSMFTLCFSSFLAVKWQSANIFFFFFFNFGESSQWRQSELLLQAIFGIELWSWAGDTVVVISLGAFLLCSEIYLCNWEDEQIHVL